MLRFIREEKGAVSVEFCLWLVVLVGVLMLAADATLLLSTQSELIDVSREIARQLVIGNITVAEVQSIVDLRFPNTTQHIAAVEERDSFYIVTVTIDFADVLVFGDAFAGDNTLEGRVVMAQEV